MLLACFWKWIMKLLVIHNHLQSFKLNTNNPSSFLMLSLHRPGLAFHLKKLMGNNFTIMNFYATTMDTYKRHTNACKEQQAWGVPNKWWTKLKKKYQKKKAISPIHSLVLKTKRFPLGIWELPTSPHTYPVYHIMVPVLTLSFFGSCPSLHHNLNLSFIWKMS